MSWRQVDCHINNLYNTTFHALLGDHLKYEATLNDSGDEVLRIASRKSVRIDGKDPLTPQQAEERLRGSFSSDKNELLFSEYGINYNNELEQFKKGTLITLPELTDDMKKQMKKESKSSYDRKINFRVLATNVIDAKFWTENAYLLEKETAQKHKINSGDEALKIKP
jgi:tRNA(His) guanylyltransferase